jgi:hypothetical protein
LFEAGHFEGDYQRNNEEIYFIALISSFITLNENDIVSNGIGKYLNIPQNKVAFYDFYIKNVKLNYDGVEKLRILLHNTKRS